MEIVEFTLVLLPLLGFTFLLLDLGWAVYKRATLQFAVSLPNFLTFEFMQSDWSKNQPNPLRHNLLEEPVEKLVDGYMEVPERPG